MVSLLKFAEKGFAVFGLLLSTAPLIPLLQSAGGSNPEPAEGYALMQALWFGMYLVEIFLLLLRWKRFLYTAIRDKPVLLLVGLALLSVVWSVSPLVTIRRSVAVLGTTLFGVYLASRYTLKEQLHLLAWALGIAMIFSIIFAVALPTYGIDWFQRGAWRGIYHQKNVLGRYMSLAGVVFLLLALDARRYRWLMWTLFFLCTALLLLSASKNALLAFLTVLILLPLYRALRFPFNIRVMFFMAVILIGSSVATVLVGNTENILRAMGKDITLTGRTELWDILLQYVKQRPWLGYGYSGFWAGRAQDTWAMLAWKPNHAHNGFLQLLLDLGIIGFLMFGISFIASAFNAVGWVNLTKSAVGLWPLAYLTFLLLSNQAESVVLATNNLLWILFISTALSMSVERVRSKKTSHSKAALSQGGWVKGV